MNILNEQEVFGNCSKLVQKNIGKKKKKKEPKNMTSDSYI